MKTVTDASVIVGLSAGVGYLAKTGDERIIPERPIRKRDKLR